MNIVRHGLPLEEETDQTKVRSRLLLSVPALGEHLPHVGLAVIRSPQLSLEKKDKNKSCPKSIPKHTRTSEFTPIHAYICISIHMEYLTFPVFVFAQSNAASNLDPLSSFSLSLVIKL